MPGSITANVLQQRPLELAIRAALAFGIAIGLSAWFSPALLDALLPAYEQVVQGLDDHYRIDLALTHQNGHDKLGSDLVVLGRATVMRTIFVLGADKYLVLESGSVLTSSTTTGLLMQPATMILGLLLWWPAGTAREVLLRGALGSILLALWMLLGIPLSLWVYFQDIPFRAYMPNELSFLMIVDKFLLNGGGLILGALVATGAIATAGWWIAHTRRA